MPEHPETITLSISPEAAASIIRLLHFSALIEDDNGFDEDAAHFRSVLAEVKNEAIAHGLEVDL